MLKNSKASTTILLVEDEKMLREAYSTLLSSNGYTVVALSDGRQALEYITSHEEPDLILLDLLMPHMDGVQFLRASNLRENHPETAVIVFSNLSSPARTSELLELGARKHIVKAEMGPKELLQLVHDELDLHDTPDHGFQAAHAAA